MNKLNEEVAEVLDDYDPVDLENLIWRMRGYVQNKINFRKGHHEGLEPIDFVFNVFEKALAEVRNWNSKECDFENFVFGVLRSEVSAAKKKAKRRKLQGKENDDIDESYLLDITVFSEEVGHEDLSFTFLDHENQKRQYLELLETAGATALEILIFECWCDDICKPQEISHLLEVDVDTVYQAVKRLERRKAKLNTTDE